MAQGGQQTADVRVAALRMAPDRVFEVNMRPGCRVEVEDMQELLAVQFEMTVGVAAVLVDARGIRSMTKAALECTANNPVNDRTAATAIVVKSAVSKLLGNFFIRFGRPPYPARLFRAEDEARVWLLEHLERHGVG